MRLIFFILWEGKGVPQCTVISNCRPFQQLSSSSSSAEHPISGQVLSYLSELLNELLQSIGANGILAYKSRHFIAIIIARDHFMRMQNTHCVVSRAIVRLVTIESVDMDGRR